MKRFGQAWFGWVVGIVLTFFGGLVVVFGPAQPALDRWSFDLPLPNHDSHRPDEAAVVYLRDQDYTALGQPLGQPLNRTNHVALVRALREAGARLIVFDFLFFNPKPEEDPAFLATLKERRDVVIAAEETDGKWQLPLESYRSNAALGHATFTPDSKYYLDADGVKRKLPGSSLTDDGLEVLSLAGAALQLLGSNVPPVGPRDYLHYYGPPEKLPAAYYTNVLNREVTPGFFSNKIVFVGFHNTTTSGGANTDMHPTPYTLAGHAGRAAGVTIHATAFLNLLHHEWFRRAPSYLVTLLFLLVAVVAGAGLTRVPPRNAVLAAVAAVAMLIVAALYFARARNIWFPWATLVVEIAIALAWSVTYNGYRSHLEQQLLRQSISKHLSPNRVNQILHNPEVLRPGGEMRDVSLMFTDIAGFSKMAQRKHPEDLVKLLNGYYEEAIAAVHGEDGMVMDLIGDSIFALWNAPYDQTDHSVRACRTALALQ